MKLRSSTITLVIGVLCLYFITPFTTAAGFNQQMNVLQLDPASSAFQTFLVDGSASDKAQHYIRLYTKRYPQYTAKMLHKAQGYFPTFSYYLEKAGLPEALKFLPLVESNLKEDIVSPTGAAGLWQFMPATARYYGLEVSDTQDDRLDIHKSSAAAAQLLKELYQQFDDWELSLAAYNCGAGRVRRAIRKAGSRDFEAIKPYLPKQTQYYTDKFFAMVYVGHHHHAFKLELSTTKEPFTNILIKGVYSVRAFCEEAKITPYVFYQLNPELKDLDYIDAPYGVQVKSLINQNFTIKNLSASQTHANRLALQNEMQKSLGLICSKVFSVDDLSCNKPWRPHFPKGLLVKAKSIWAIKEKTAVI